jgi:ATP-binding cassette subfamily B protein
VRQILRKLLFRLNYLPGAWRLVWAAAPRWTVAWAVLLAAQGLLPVATIFLTRRVVDALVAAMRREPGAGPETVLLLVGAMAGLLLLGEVLAAVSKWVRAAQSELVQDYIIGLIHDQALALDLSFYESPAYFDCLYQARTDAHARPLALLEGLGNTVQGALTLLAMAGLLLAFGWWMPLLLIFSAVPALFVVVRYAQRQNDWRLRTTQDRRRADYYDWLLLDQHAAAEMRLFDLGRYFRPLYQTLRARLRGEQLALSRAQAVGELLAGACGLAALGASVAWVLWRAALGQFSLGQVALFYQAFSQGQKLMHTLLENVGQIYSNTLFLDNLFEFLELKPNIGPPERPAPAPALREAVRFENVTFSYPGSERAALEDFNLTLPAGQIVAVVGENGSGKSTLIKLLCRFYDPQRGRVTCDGVDLREINPTDLWRMVTTLFQEPVHFRVTAGENIALGDWQSAPAPEALRAAARAAGADAPIANLPAEYDTPLSKYFGGSELSVGEWQRVALARAFLRQAALIALDEPTSAMDSWAEADWMSRFRALVAGRTAIVITHRFTTARQADVIHVMAGGRIVESGRHDELLARNGRYAQAWRQQTREWQGQKPARQ